MKRCDPSLLRSAYTVQLPTGQLGLLFWRSFLWAPKPCRLLCRLRQRLPSMKHWAARTMHCLSRCCTPACQNFQLANVRCMPVAHCQGV